MPSLVVIGAQWGDEGKGKLVDYLTAKADSVVRFQGGNNAGHTLVVDGKTTKLSLVPSGILQDHAMCALGAGVVVDPFVLLDEIAQLKAAGVSVTPERLVIDRDAHIIFEYHKLLDAAKEASRGAEKLGTTGRGIGPAYADRATRCGVRFAELSDLPRLKEKVFANIEHANLQLAHVLKSDLQCNPETVWDKFESICSQLSPFVGNVSLQVAQSLENEARVVFEGAQGTLLDQVHGTVPFVTSSNTIAGAVTTGVGIGPKSVDFVLGVAKAYVTRVGTGPFPTELSDTVGDRLADRGAEFGTVTGRKRRCGWFDAVAMKRAVRLNGVDALAITKLDVLSGFEKLKICIKYDLDGTAVDDVPALDRELERVEPHYIELNGWDADISGARKWHHLPAEARLYLSTISEIIGCQVNIVSVGPERDATLFSSSASFVKNFV